MLLLLLSITFFINQTSIATRQDIQEDTESAAESERAFEPADLAERAKTAPSRNKQSARHDPRVRETSILPVGAQVALPQPTHRLRNSHLQRIEGV